MSYDFYPTPSESLTDIRMNFDLEVLQDFPTDGKIYLNNASVSLMPLPSIQAVTNFLTTYNKIGPDSLESEILIKEKLILIRKAIADLINCQPDEIILTQSTTDGINYVSNGLELDPNSNIIIRGLDHEHHANYFPWLRLSEKVELRSLKIDQNGFFDINELKKLVDGNTKIVVLSHALYNTGSILPVEEIGEFLERENIPFFLDAAQTVGCLGDYDFKKTKSNFLSFNGSKWLCGPMGTGIFFCRRDSSELLEPITIGGESAMIYEKDKLAYKEMPDKFQTGFRNYAGIVGLESSISYLQKFGLENIRQKIIKLSNQLRNEISQINGITLYGPEEENERTSIVSFSFNGHKPEELVEKLEKQKIVLATREIFEKKIVRVSPHFFNTELDIQRVVEEIKKL